MNSFEVVGVKQTLNQLNKFDPTFRKLTNKNIRTSGQVIVKRAISLVPTRTPLGGMLRGSLIKGRPDTKWVRDKVIKGFKIKATSASRNARTVNYANGNTINYKAKPFEIMVAQSKDPAAVIWDHAKISGQFVNSLNIVGAAAPRDIDIAVEESRPEVTADVLKIIKEAETQLNKYLNVKY